MEGGVRERGAKYKFCIFLAQGRRAKTQLQSAEFPHFHSQSLSCPDPSCGYYYHGITTVIINIIYLLISITYSSSLPSLKNQAGTVPLKFSLH